jgi:PAS domain S-box-containing protein
MAMDTMSQAIDMAFCTALLLTGAIKTAEEALRKSEERVRLILDSTAQGIFGCDPNGICLFCNAAAVRLLGYDDTSELLGKNMHALEHHTRADGSPYPIEECPIYIGFQKGEGVHRDDEVYWRKDGTCFLVEFWSHPVFQEGRTVGTVIAFVDTTERRKVEEALRRSEQRKRSVLEINNAIITNLTQEALLSSISEALRASIPFDLCAIKLYTPQTDTFRFVAVAGDLRSDYYQPGLEVVRAETSAGWVFDHQQPLRRNLDEERPFANEKRLWAEGLRSLCMVPLILRGKSIETVSVVSRKKDPYSEEHARFLQEVAIQVALAIGNMKSYEEIATLKARLEKENVYLREEIRTAHNFSSLESWQEHISSSGLLFTAIVHDLRNPLGAVYTGAEMLMDLDPAPAQVKRLAANIYRAAGRMRTLLADLASASSGNKLTSEICRIRDVIAAASEAALPAAETQGVQILHDVPDGIEIPLVRSRIERVFFNLITNALDAMPNGGKITIGAKKADNCVLIEVEDTGPGIPHEIRHRLFEPFVTAGKDNGLGLGLALSRETVLDHGGDMWVEPARGARFVVRLPLKDRHRKESGHSDDLYSGQRRRPVEGGHGRSAAAHRAAVDAL